MSLSGSPQRWVCRACHARNTVQYSRCAACDCINPETLYPKAIAAVASNSAAGSSGGSPLPARPPGVEAEARRIASSPHLSPHNQSSFSVQAQAPSWFPDVERLERQLNRAAEVNKALVLELKQKDERLTILEQDNLAQREELKALSNMLIEMQHSGPAAASSAEGAMGKELEAAKDELRDRKQSPPREPSASNDIQLENIAREITSLRDAFHDSNREGREFLSKLVVEQQNRSVEGVSPQLRAENEALRQQVAALQQKLDETAKQRDDFAQDVRFNLALLTECQSDRATLKAKLFELAAGNTSSPSSSLAAESSALIVSDQRVAELQKLVKVLESQVQSVELAKQESIASLQQRLDSASFLEEQLKSAQFVNSELRKQCDVLKEKIATKDFDIAEAGRHLAEAERKLVAERDFHDRARKDVETLEKKLESVTAEWRARVDSLNRQLNEHQTAQAELLERYDALEIAADDVRTALADALDALASRPE